MRVFPTFWGTIVVDFLTKMLQNVPPSACWQAEAGMDAGISKTR